MGALQAMQDQLTARYAIYDQQDAIRRIVDTTDNHYRRFGAADDDVESMQANLYAALAHSYLVLEGLLDLHIDKMEYYTILTALEQQMSRFEGLESRLSMSGALLDFAPVPDLGSEKLPHWRGYRDISDEKEAFVQYFGDIRSRMPLIRASGVGEYLKTWKAHYPSINQAMGRLEGFKTPAQQFESGLRARHR